MKLKYHKIRNVEKAICTAEQMIAYNMAFRAHISFGDRFRKLDSAMAKDDAVHGIIANLFKQYHNGYDYKAGKFNEDAIQAALNAGLRSYLEKPFVAQDYETVGRAFPAHYL